MAGKNGVIQLIHKLKNIGKKIYRSLYRKLVILHARMTGPPYLLAYRPELNLKLLRLFGAIIGDHKVRVLPPITIKPGKNGYQNLTIMSGCILNGNNYLDLSGKITLEEGVSLGPGVTIMTHNRFNYNPYLEDKLADNCGVKDVLIKEGSGIKAGALIVMGVTVGENSVVAGGSVVNRDIPPYSFVAGIPATPKKDLS